MHIHLITASDTTYGGHRDLLRHLTSVRRQEGVEVSSYLFLHNSTSGLGEKLKRDFPHVKHVVESHTLAPLSDARNKLLAYVTAGAADDDLIAFPDNDAWFAPNSLRAAVDIISETGVDILCGALETADKVVHPKFPPTAGHLTARRCIVHVCSCTMFLKKKIVARVGEFDTRLGLGTKLHSGEDIDYILRAIKTSDKALYEPRVRVGHAMSTQNKYYYLGGVAVVRKHAPEFPICTMLAGRSILSGIRLYARGAIPLGQLLEALRIVAFGLPRRQRSL